MDSAAWLLHAARNTVHRVERVASLLGLDRTSDPESLAWMIDRSDASGREEIYVISSDGAGTALSATISVWLSRKTSLM